MLVRAFEVRHQSNVYKQAVFTPHLKRYLTHRLDEGLTFYVAYRTAYLGDDDVRLGLFFKTVDEILDLVRYVRDDNKTLKSTWAAGFAVRRCRKRFCLLSE